MPWIFVDFAMNDKCAAGTGRFLEMMSRTLEIPLNKMGSESADWKEQIAITSICTVFAESEVVSLIAQNKNKADIIHGLNNSISGKAISMLDRVGRKPSYMMSGGVAKNIGVVKSIEEKLGESLYIYDEPEIVGALGAALIALENVQK
jgi:predicted CoA-substrate-specific enzyme activase